MKLKSYVEVDLAFIKPWWTGDTVCLNCHKNIGHYSRLYILANIGIIEIGW